MIFLTVGSQLPFDRLTRAVDEWCATRGGAKVFGQIGNPGSGGFYPSRFAWQRVLSPQAFDENISKASLVVAHAGMGSIISALTMAKPIVIMPRRGVLGETRNDHQYATAMQFSDRAGIHVAFDEFTLPETIDSALACATDAKAATPFANEELLVSIRSFIEGTTVRAAEAANDVRV